MNPLDMVMLLLHYYWEMYKKGEITKDDWNDIVNQYSKSIKNEA